MIFTALYTHTQTGASVLDSGRGGRGGGGDPGETKQSKRQGKGGGISKEVGKTDLVALDYADDVLARTVGEGDVSVSEEGEG